MAEAPEAPTPELTLEDVRRSIRLELVELTTHPGAELIPSRVEALAGAYVRLGGNLELPPPPRRINPADVDVVERVTAAAWQAASVKGATPDTIADAVRLSLTELAR